MYAIPHWTKRNLLSREAHGIIRAALIDLGYSLYTSKHIFPFPVHIVCTATFQKQLIDCDNLCAKIYIDGLKGILLTDDSPEYVASVSLRTMPIKTIPSLTLELFKA